MADVMARPIAPNFDRLNYFYGQLLGHHQFHTEQAYFREKLKLHNRCLHGWGVVCGLGVELPPAATPPLTTPAVQVDPGLGLDPSGNELVVRDPIVIPDVTKLLTAAEQAGLSPNGSTVWLLLCYQERGIEPTRPVMPDSCGGSGDCLYGMTREQVCVKATTTQPLPPTGGCCDPPPDQTCLVLAQLDGVIAGQLLTADQIETDVRTLAGAGTTITGAGWNHQATYQLADATTLMGDIVARTGGLRLQFSAPLLIDSFNDDRHVMDVVLLRPTTGDMIYVDGLVVPGPPQTGDPANTTRLLTWFRNTKLPPPGTPMPQSGDRVFVTLRSPLILDVSCRPVDGANVGGLIPALPGSPTPLPFTAFLLNGCPSRPRTSGNGSAGNFESWFTVK
jgi:hypothetical protein